MTHRCGVNLLLNKLHSYSGEHLQYDLCLSTVHRWQPCRKELSAPDHVNPLVSCADDRLGHRNQTATRCEKHNHSHTLLSVPSEMLSRNGEDFHVWENRRLEEQGKRRSVVCGGKEKLKEVRETTGEQNRSGWWGERCQRRRYIDTQWYVVTEEKR